jgi:hypothetical protein
VGGYVAVASTFTPTRLVYAFSDCWPTMFYVFQQQNEYKNDSPDIPADNLHEHRRVVAAI